MVAGIIFILEAAVLVVAVEVDLAASAEAVLAVVVQGGAGSCP